MSIRKITSATSSLVVSASTTRAGIFKATAQTQTGIKRIQNLSSILIPKIAGAVPSIVDHLAYDPEGIGIRKYIEYLLASDRSELYITLNKSETVVASDYAFATLGFIRNFYDNVVPVEIFDILLISNRYATDTISIRDTEYFLLRKSLEDTQTISDTDRLFVNLGKQDSISLTDTDRLLISKRLTDSVAETDAEQIWFNKVRADAVAGTEDLITYVAQFKSDTVAATERDFLQLSKPFAEILVASDADRLYTIKSFFDPVATTDSRVTFFINKRLNDTQPTIDLVGVYDGLNYNYSLARFETVVNTDYFSRIFNAIRGPRDGFADTTTITDKDYLWLNKAATDSVLALDVKALYVGLRKTDAVAETDKATKSVTKRAFDSVTESDDQTFWVNKSNIDTVIFSDFLQSALGRNFVDSISLTDTDRITFLKRLGDTEPVYSIADLFDGHSHHFVKDRVLTVFTSDLDVLYFNKTLADLATSTDRDLLLLGKRFFESVSETDTETLFVNQNKFDTSIITDRDTLFAGKSLSDLPAMLDREYLALRKVTADTQSVADRDFLWFNKFVADTTLMFDAYTINDGSTYSVWKNVFDNVLLGEEQKFIFLKSLQDAAVAFDEYTVSDGLRYNAYKYAYDTLSQTDTEKFTVLKTASDNNSVWVGNQVTGIRRSDDVLENVSFWFRKPATDSLSPLDQFLYAFSRSERAADSVLITDRDYYWFNKALRDSVTQTDTDNFTFLKTASDNNRVWIGNSVAGIRRSGDTLENITFTMLKKLFDDQTVDEAIIVQRFTFLIDRQLADSSTVTDVKSFWVNKVDTDAVTITERDFLLTGKRIGVETVSTADTDTLTALLTKRETAVTADAKSFWISMVDRDTTTVLEHNYLFVNKTPQPDTVTVSDTRRFLIGARESDSIIETDAESFWLNKTAKLGIDRFNVEGNILTHSENVAGWVSYTSGVVLASDSVTAPDGTLTADVLTFAGAGYRYHAWVTGNHQGQTLTGSVWLWSPDGSKNLVGFRLNDSSIGTDQTVTSITLTTIPTRYSITRTFTTSGTSIDIGIDNRSGIGGNNTSGSVAVWGLQLNSGTVAGPYVRTTNAGIYIVNDTANSTDRVRVGTYQSGNRTTFDGLEKVSFTALKRIADTSIAFDEYTISDGLRYNAYKLAFDTVSELDTDYFWFNKVLRDSETIEDVAVAELTQRLVLKTTSDTVTVTDLDFLLIGKPVRDSITETDTDRLWFNKNASVDQTVIPGQSYTYWTQTIGFSSGVTTSLTYAAYIDEQGYYYIGGYRRTATYTSEAFVAKLSSNGTILWNQVIDFIPDTQHELYSISNKGDTLYIQGLTDALVTSNVTLQNRAPFVARIDSSTGAYVWGRYLVTSLGTTMFSTNQKTARLIATTSNVYSLTNLSYSNNLTFDWSFVKYDSDGNTVVNTQFKATGTGDVSVLLSDADQDAAENIYAVGSIGQIGSRTTGILAKFDSSGTILWQNQLPAGEGSIIRSIKVQTDCIYLCGFVDTTSVLSAALLWVAKLDNTGSTIQWQNTYDLTANDRFTSPVNVLTNGGLNYNSLTDQLYVNAITQSDNTPFTMVLDSSNGSIVWARKTSTTANHVITALDAANNAILRQRKDNGYITVPASDIGIVIAGVAEWEPVTTSITVSSSTYTLTTPVSQLVVQTSRATVAATFTSVVAQTIVTSTLTSASISLGAYSSVVNQVIATDIFSKLAASRKATADAQTAADYGILLMQNYAGAFYFAEDYVGISDYFNFPYAITNVSLALILDTPTVLNIRKSISSTDAVVTASDTSSAWIALAGDLQTLSGSIDLQTNNDPADDLNDFSGRPLLGIIQELGLTDNLKLCLDAGDIASYNPAIQTTKWLDVSGNGYDFFRGTSTGGDAAEPTFNGGPGGAWGSEYWSWDASGADRFTYDSTSETWMDNLHKNNAKFTILVAIYFSNVTTLQRIVSNSDGLGAVGIRFHVSNSNLVCTISNGDGVTQVFNANTTGVAQTGFWHIAALSLDETVGAAGALTFVNNQINYFNSTYTSPSNSAPQFTMHLGVKNPSGVEPLASGSRMACVAMWEGTALTAQNLQDIYEQLKPRFGLG